MILNKPLDLDEEGNWNIEEEERKNKDGNMILIEWNGGWVTQMKWLDIPITCHVLFHLKWVLYPLSTKVPTNLNPQLKFKY